MARAVVIAFWFAACWSCPAILAHAQVVLAHAMISAINHTDWVLADIETNRAKLLAPTCGAKALTLHAHAMGSAICVLKFWVPVSTMLIFAVFSKPCSHTFAESD